MMELVINLVCVNWWSNYYVLIDKVFDPSCSTLKVYEEGAKNVALSALTGINGNYYYYYDDDDNGGGDDEFDDGEFVFRDIWEVSVRKFYFCSDNFCLWAN